MNSSKLTAIYFSISVALACLIMDIGHSFAEETQNGFNVKYAPGTTLSDEELDSVANTAYRAGIGEIVLIQIGGEEFPNAHLIRVHERSTDDGLFIKYRLLSVGSVKFGPTKQETYYRKLEHRAGPIIIDGFWSMGFVTVTYFPTYFNGENVQINVDEGINRDDLIRIVDALKSYDILFKEDELAIINVATAIPY